MSTEEITQMLQSLGIVVSPERIAALTEEADTDRSGEISFEEFFEAMQRAEFAELVQAAAHPADVARSLEEANAHFANAFNEFVVGALASCQDEVLAAKVPLASFGRVKTALDNVRNQLTGSAQQLLTGELAKLRTKAIRSMHAQRAQLEASFAVERQSAIEAATREVHAQVVDAEGRVHVANTEIKRLRDLGTKPQETIERLEAELNERETELKKASTLVAHLEAAAAKAEDEWKSGYQKAINLCSIPPPPPIPEPPFIKVLTRTYARVAVLRAPETERAQWRERFERVRTARARSHSHSLRSLNALSHSRGSCSGRRQTDTERRSVRGRKREREGDSTSRAAPCPLLIEAHTAAGHRMHQCVHTDQLPPRTTRMQGHHDEASL